MNSAVGAYGVAVPAQVRRARTPLEPMITLLGLQIAIVGSTMLGIALLRNGFRPRATSWLLALNIPLPVGVVQFTSLGSAALPIMVAFAIAGRQIARELLPPRRQQSHRTPGVWLPDRRGAQSRKQLLRTGRRVPLTSGPSSTSRPTACG